MTCEEALLLLSGHLDGANTGAEEAQLQAHLAQCEACRTLLEELRALDEGLLSLNEEPPADLCQSVMESIRREAPAQKKKRRWVWPTAAAAAVLVLLAGAGALAAPKVRTSGDAAPELARMMTAEAVEDMAAPEVGLAMAAPDMTDALPQVSLYSGTEDTLLPTAAPEDDLAQSLADQRNAGVVLLYTSVPELDGLPCEVLEDGSLLYTLESAGQAQALWEAHPDDAVLYLPETETAAVSYALLP